MAEAQNLQPQSPDNLNFSLRIWPPSQRTRDAVIRHLAQTLSSPSTLTNRYGNLPPEEAATVAKTIEEESFFAAAESSTAPTGTSVEDEASRGIEILQVYSREISGRMLEVVKRAKAENQRQEDTASSEESKV